MGNPNIKDHAVKFGSGQDPTKGGRPKKIYTILKEKGFSKDDIRTAFGELAWYNLDELKAVHKDKKMPVITRIVANQFYLALKDGNWNKVKEILEHTIGKPNQKMDLNHGVQEDNMEKVIFKLGHKPLRKKK